MFAWKMNILEGGNKEEIRGLQENFTYSKPKKVKRYPRFTFALR
jgi:hypothetical protein